VQEPEEEGEVDMEGLNPRDVELVMAQSGVSKAR
jgi:NACalpha-BTF3-like transcription factor